MLVLSRKTNEAIRIVDNVCITVVSIDGGAVKLGIEAPQDVPIHREEVYARIQEENRRAAQQVPSDLSRFARQWKMPGRSQDSGVVRE